MEKIPVKKAIELQKIPIKDLLKPLGVKTRKSVYDRISVYDGPNGREAVDPKTGEVFDKIVKSCEEMLKKKETLESLPETTKKIAALFSSRWGEENGQSLLFEDEKDPNGYFPEEGMFESRYDTFVHEESAAWVLMEHQSELDKLIKNHPSLETGTYPGVHFGVVPTCSIETETGYRVILVPAAASDQFFGKDMELARPRFTIHLYIVTELGLVKMDSIRVEGGKLYADISVPKGYRYAYQVYVEWVRVPYPEKILPEEEQRYSLERREKKPSLTMKGYDFAVDPRTLPDIWSLKPEERARTEMLMLN